MQQSTMNIRIDKNTKKEAENLFDSMGLTLSAAVNLFIKQALYEQAIPFTIHRKPNVETLKAMQEAEDILAGKIPAKRFKTTKEMFEELDKLV